MIAVLLVEYYAAMRDRLRLVLDCQRELAVVALAGSRSEAVRLARKSRPDVVLLGASLPDGAVPVVRALRSQTDAPIVVYQEGRSPAGHVDALLHAGAVAVVPAEADLTDVCLAVRAASQTRVKRDAGVLATRVVEPRVSIEGAVVAVAVSTGGPQVLARILGDLPATFSAPIAIVQHMIEGFQDQFVDWLSAAAHRPVRVAVDGEVMALGSVYVAPSGRQLSVADGRQMRVTDDPPVDGHRPSANVLFASLARSPLRLRIGVILTGMGSDGARGLKLLRQSGGYTVAQDAASCAVYGMPRAAVELDAASELADPAKIADRLVALVAASTGGGPWSHS